MGKYLADSYDAALRENADLKTRLAEAEALLHWAGRQVAAQSLSAAEIRAFLKGTAWEIKDGADAFLAGSAPAALDLERVEIARCPRCGALPRPTLMGRTVCPNGHGDVDQPMPAATAPAALSAEEHCKLFCAWKGGGPCLADDCPRRKADQAPAAREDGPADEYLAGIMNRRKAPKP